LECTAVVGQALHPTQHRREAPREADAVEPGDGLALLSLAVRHRCRCAESTFRTVEAAHVLSRIRGDGALVETDTEPGAARLDVALFARTADAVLLVHSGLAAHAGVRLLDGMDARRALLVVVADVLLERRRVLRHLLERERHARTLVARTERALLRLVAAREEQLVRHADLVGIVTQIGRASW